MELFHYEFQHEQQQYRQQKKKEDDEKLDAIMKYTLTTFKRLNFGETEIFQFMNALDTLLPIGKFLPPRKYISRNESRYANLTKKLCMEYCLPTANISGDATAKFVLHTFNEWFANSTIDTIREELRTTTGRQ